MVPVRKTLTSEMDEFLTIAIPYCKVQNTLYTYFHLVEMVLINKWYWNDQSEQLNYFAKEFNRLYPYFDWKRAVKNKK